MLIAYNPASKATPPKKGKPQPNYFQPGEIAAILEALEHEPIKWRVIIHLLLITGARRGEIAGLKWSAIDWDNSRIHIGVNLLNRTDIGIYEDTPKTEMSDRYIQVPAETMQLLREYYSYWTQLRSSCGSHWNLLRSLTGAETKRVLRLSICLYRHRVIKWDILSAPTA